MTTITEWMQAHKFEAHLAVFLGMVIPAALLYPAAQSNQPGWLWVLLGAFALANLGAMVIK